MGGGLGCDFEDKEWLAQECARNEDGRQLAVLNYGPEAFEMSFAMAGHFLLQAAANGDENGVKQAIRLGAPLECRRPFTIAPTPRSRGAEEVIESIDDEGMTPLMHAALSGNSNCVALLLRAMADVNSLEEDGLTPLHFAAKALAMNSCKLLVKSRAQCDLADSEGRTALMYALSELRPTAKERDIWTVTLCANHSGGNTVSPTDSPSLKSGNMHTQVVALENEPCRTFPAIKPAFGPLEVAGGSEKPVDIGKNSDTIVVDFTM